MAVGVRKRADVLIREGVYQDAIGPTKIIFLLEGQHGDMRSMCGNFFIVIIRSSLFSARLFIVIGAWSLFVCITKPRFIVIGAHELRVIGVIAGCPALPPQLRSTRK